MSKWIISQTANQDPSPWARSVSPTKKRYVGPARFPEAAVSFYNDPWEAKMFDTLEAALAERTRVVKAAIVATGFKMDFNVEEYKAI